MVELNIHIFISHLHTKFTHEMEVLVTIYTTKPEAYPVIIKDMMKIVHHWVNSNRLLNRIKSTIMRKKLTINNFVAIHEAFEIKYN